LNNSQGECMKLKTWVAIAVTSMLATSLGYAANSTVKLIDDNGSAMQGSGTSENIGAVPSGNGSSMNSNSNNDNSMPSDNSSSSNSNDDMSADTATGDDDY
jgi:hypothetical protein